MSKKLFNPNRFDTKLLFCSSVLNKKLFTTRDVCGGIPETGLTPRDSTVKHQLLNPFRLEETEEGNAKFSIFENKFQTAELGELQKLQKHVKLAPRFEELTTINGRKICWKFQKGKCSFGMKCKYAHFTDLVQNDCESMPVHLDSNEESMTQLTFKQQIYDEFEVKTMEEIKKRKKRPGLSQHIVPSKKAMKLYNKTKTI